MRFFRARFSTESFFGFPLTALVFLALACVWLFVTVVQDYLAQDLLVAADVRIENLLFAFRSVQGVRVFYVVTLLASPITGAAVVAFLGVALYWSRRRMMALLGILGFVGSQGTTAVLKLLFHRARPDLLLRAVSEDSFSLPSGHATQAAFVLGFLGYLACVRFRGLWSRIAIVSVVALGVLMMDVSRLYLGVHFFSDVLSGNAIGFFALFVVIIADQWLHARRGLGAYPVRVWMILCAILVAVLSAASLFYADASPWSDALPRPQTRAVAPQEVMTSTIYHPPEQVP